MEFDYFYGPEDAEQYQFYRIPKLLISCLHLSKKRMPGSKKSKRSASIFLTTARPGRSTWNISGCR